MEKSLFSISGVTVEVTLIEEIEINKDQKIGIYRGHYLANDDVISFQGNNCKTGEDVKAACAEHMQRLGHLSDSYIKMLNQAANNPAGR